MEDGAIKEIHVNKIRPYLARIEQVGVIYDQDGDFGEILPIPAHNGCGVNCDIQGRIYEQGKELSSQQKVELVHILSNYSHAFSRTPGKAKVPGHSIKVNDDCIPKRSAPYRFPVALQEEVERQIHEVLEMGLIEHSDSDWAHPVVCVAKKNGNVRLCVYYRQLNKFTNPDAYPRKLITELLYEVGKARFISVLDLTKGYWQIPMKPEAKHYTAFVTHSGLYQWNVMPFGMKNAGSTFQRSMDKILSKHRRYCRAYIHDVAIFSENWEEHMRHIREVFQTLQVSNLTVNLENKKLTPTQMRWATIEREAYAVLEALKKYDTWVFGARIQVISDHNPLTYLTQETPHSAKLTRWSLALQRYDVTISYRKGSMHGNADSLSRLPAK
ncbi:Transposon Ty3-I Gag-Pol polyprotein [Araneus ventricosus]|uniref:Transposon Ty3-I Gag-Pol polyprotein n=1 Tax=Araneus ventricosus TaxID=182803 RepID=A0A4Y2PDF2_ARAVE|nr:Transposon Ty3-I Gag-Pol polyprotein [Araneus ventricosus]